MNKSISVKQLNLYVKSLLEGDIRLNCISVEGELSDFKNHYSSGHWYFTLKDESSAVRCVMFKASASRVKFNPENGMSVIITGRVSLYEKDGQYQFYVDSMLPVGEGDLGLAFKFVKEKLQKEGLFDESTKRPIPQMPKRIAVITSDTGAAVRDICSTLEKRCPFCEIVLCPVTVQGDNAAKSMINALDKVYALSGIDTVIIGRGGGSAEDLASFNDENLARKIYESPFPVISAVGHETDFTICDFVADKRAATPTAAAVIASPDIMDLCRKIGDFRTRIEKSVWEKTEIIQSRYKVSASSAVLKNPCDVFDRKLQTVDFLEKRLVNSIDGIFEKKDNGFKNLAGLLDSLSPLKTLNRGFSAVTKNGKLISSVKALKEDDEINIMLSDGSLDAVVRRVENGTV